MRMNIFANLKILFFLECRVVNRVNAIIWISIWVGVGKDSGWLLWSLLLNGAFILDWMWVLYWGRLVLNWKWRASWARLDDSGGCSDGTERDGSGNLCHVGSYELRRACDGRGGCSCGSLC